VSVDSLDPYIELSLPDKKRKERDYL